MAEDLVTIEPDEETAAGEQPYQNRFQLLFGVLLGVGMAAVVATVIVIASGGRGNGLDSGAVSWAPWHPTADNGQEAVKQIAQHVQARYLLPSGHQLVAVRGGPLEMARLPVTIALDTQGAYTVIDDTGVLYNLCGGGQNCSIKEGKPTIARSLVLRRESLELALYTFRYIKNINEVVVMLPPAPGKKPTYAMFYRRGDVTSSLDRPLAATLPGAPPVPPMVPRSEQDSINRLTLGNLFQFSPQEGADARVYLVLSRP